MNTCTHVPHLQVREEKVEEFLEELRSRSRTRTASLAIVKWVPSRASPFFAAFPVPCCLAACLHALRGTRFRRLHGGVPSHDPRQ